MRLTDKLENGNYDILEQEDVCVARPLRPERYHLMIQKLGQLEDIEEELGIDLITLFKALKRKKVWLVVENIITKETKIVESCFELQIYADYNGKLFCWLWFEKYAYQIPAKTYGKTWTLTKEELTNGK